MKRNTFVWLLASFLLTPFFPAEAQQPGKIPQIGYVSSSGDPNNPGPLVEAFRQALRDLGYIEGKNIVVEYRHPGAEPDRVPSFVAAFVQQKVDVLVSSSAAALRAAKEATKTIPIVMMASFDPVATGMVDSLARPGGNITGVTRLTHELSGKRLELFKEAVPGISRVGVLADVESRSLLEYAPTARALKISLESLGVRSPTPDLEGAFQAAAKARVNGLITVGSRLINRHRKQILEFATKNRIPSIFEVSVWVEAGGLISYSSAEAENFKRAAAYVDKILKGAKPADLPVEQPTKFELVINLKTAKQIGVTIPQSVLFRADKVIK
jgi:putative ABC transport system substrate-binding protein